MMPSFSVVMPVYNERETLEHGVRSVAAYLAALHVPSEILVIESGSTDGTSEIADALARELPGVRVIHEGERNGFGSALQLGYAEARYEWVWLVTPDLPFPLETLEHAIPILGNYDAVLSYRSDDNRNAFRRLQSFCFQKLVTMAFGLRMRCVNSAFKLLRREFVQNLRLRSRGWTIDAEIACILDRSGSKYVEIGVPLTERACGASKVTVGAISKVLRDILRLWLVRNELAVTRTGEENCEQDAKHGKTAAYPS